MIQSKFTELRTFLENSGKVRITLTFSEIENILGETLCASAYKYKVYWYPSPTHTCALMIQEANYQVEYVDLNAKKIQVVKKED